MFKTNPIPISNRKRIDNNNLLKNENIIKKKCDEINQHVNLQKLQKADKDWPSDCMGNDSIFSEIDLADEQFSSSNTPTTTTPATLSSLDSEQNLVGLTDDNSPAIQCTQQFLNDLNASIFPIIPELSNNDLLDYTNFFCESQYTTSEEIHNKTLKNKTILNPHVENDVLNVTEITELSPWRSQKNVSTELLDKSFQLGPFYGLPEYVKQLIYEHKNIQNLYEWQKECLNLPAIQNRKNLIYALPTSGGKTLVAEILMLRETICRKKNVIFLLPYVSIVQEKVSAMSPFALSLDFLVEEYTAGKGKCPPPVRNKRKSVFIASIEKGAVLFDSLIEARRANEIGLVVVDELHLIGEKGRGSSLETFLTKVMYLKAGIQIIGMSATIGNLPDISKFLDADIYTRGFRPVELKEYLKCGDDILEINSRGRTLDSMFTFNRTVQFKYSPSILKSDPDHLAGLVAEVIPNESCLIFCSTRKNCENVALLLTKILSKNKYVEYKKAEKSSLIDAINTMCGAITPTLAETIPFGVAYHHSGLTSDERKLIETAYKFGTLCVICCTSTLAAGVNLPAKRVIIRAPYVGKQLMTLCQYKQMIGRAGRAGMGGSGESILICSSKDNIPVGDMLKSPMDKIKSAMTEFDAAGLQALILSGIGLEIIDNLGDLLKLINFTLLSVQSEELDVNTNTLATDIIKLMFRKRIIKLTQNDFGLNYSNSTIITTQEYINTSHEMDLMSKKIVLSRQSKFELSVIGKAAFKAGIDYTRAKKMYHELKKGQESLVLTNFSHLLYLIVALNSHDDFINVDPNILFREYNNLDQGTQHLVKILGITEGNAVKMYKTMSIRGPKETQFSRLYKVLILNDILNIMPIHLVASKYLFERGTVQSLISQSVAGASCIVRLCEQIDEFWCYKPLFEKLSEKLDRCCTNELIPLLELPGVKLNRAKQFFAAGFKTIEDISKCQPNYLCKSINHLPLKIAKEIVAAAKLHLLQKLETLQEETQALLSCLNLS